MLKPLRIVVVLDHYDPHYGGLESWADQWARWLVRRGHDVHVAAFDIAPGVAYPGIIPHVLPPASGRLARAAEAERFLESMKPDVVYDLGVGWRYDILHPAAGSRLSNARQDVLSLGLRARLRRRLSPWHARRSREFRALEKRQFGPGPGIVVAISRMVQADLERRYDLDPARIRLVYNGVDLRRLAGLDARTCRDDLRSTLGLHDEVLFLFVGHNFRLKGLGPALEALAILSRARQLCHLAVIGRGPREEYQAKARRLGVLDRVSFHGHVTDVRPFFGGADAFVLPTFHDACSLVAAEAWAFGLPVITTRFNGAAELMTSGVQGWILDDPRDTRALARRMESLFDPGRRKTMSAAARELGSSLSLENNFARIEEIIAEMRETGRS
jgi:UDP-glucose:(heptosyl)LPS alpha-1,3-glucosyltransferase